MDLSVIMSVKGGGTDLRCLIVDRHLWWRLDPSFGRLLVDYFLQHLPALFQGQVGISPALNRLLVQDTATIVDSLGLRMIFDLVRKLKGHIGCQLLGEFLLHRGQLNTRLLQYLRGQDRIGHESGMNIDRECVHLGDSGLQVSRSQLEPLGGQGCGGGEARESGV